MSFTPLQNSSRSFRSAPRSEAPSAAAAYAPYGTASAAARLRASQAADRAASRQRPRAERGSLIRYATDNAVVRAFNTLTTGTFRFAFWAAVVLIAGASLYFPLRGWYVAERSKDIKNELYEQQLSVNAAAQETVDKLLSQEGIKDIARSKLGMVEPGEVSGVVVGLDEQGADDADKDAATANDTAADPAAEKDGEGAADAGAGAGKAAQAAEADAATNDAADAQASPWYQSVLDALFFFSLDDVQGLTTVSSGA